MRYAVAADHVFDGATRHRHAAVLVEGSHIVDVVPRGEASGDVRELPEGAWLAPGFIDVQVNGGGDVLFNDAPTPRVRRTKRARASSRRSVYLAPARGRACVSAYSRAEPR
jgi:N-acetylglucosamine-6-phosphate deacetylase